MITSKLIQPMRPAPQSAFVSIALLLLRLIAGIAFVLHGWGKIQTPFDWNPPKSPVNIPGVLQFLAALSEFGGGIAWIAGFLMPFASLGIGFTMIVAVFMHSMVLGDPFVNMTGGSSYELALVYLGIALVFSALGPGKFSLDKMVFGDRNQRTQKEI